MEKRDGWRTREPRRRRFDDEGFRGEPAWASPAARPPGRTPSFAPSGPEVDASVKWFNPDKGFGFVELSDGTGDAFLHASALTRAGGTTLAAGTPLKVRVGQGQKGRQVTEITEIGEAPSSPPAGGRREGGFRQGGAAVPGAQFSSGQEMGGTVKWYNAQKGFGFITPEIGGKDVFVHATALARSGITELHEGQAVRLQVVQGKKGPEAASISLS